ncbi:spermidine synthase-like [Corticium candelabrum]|uniref:spermidine synthase-like n=1 Tax=Corticium candelabrum TaxID=121492 RepID=UPI002E26E1F3|nr:spermidine synthase-like [Corticium candelabrum]
MYLQHLSKYDGPWLEQCHLHCKYKMCKTLFLSTSYCYASIPTYPCGELGFVLSSISSDVRFDHPLREVSQEMVRMMGFKYYNSDVHKSSFVLPQFAKETLGIS